MSTLKNYSNQKVGFYKDEMYKFAGMKMWFFISIMVLLSTLTFLY